MSFPETGPLAAPVPMIMSFGSAHRRIVGLQHASVQIRPKGFGENPVSDRTTYADSFMAGGLDLITVLGCPRIGIRRLFQVAPRNIRVREDWHNLLFARQMVAR